MSSNTFAGRWLGRDDAKQKKPSLIRDGPPIVIIASELSVLVNGVFGADVLSCEER